MTDNSPTAGPTNDSGTPSSEPSPKRPWHPAVLERLGAWRALTLQQSIPIGPGTGFRFPESGEITDHFA